MAINTTRGLPTFVENYNAWKNKGAIGDVLKSGFEGYFKGLESKDAKRKLDIAQQEADTAQMKAALDYEAKQNVDPYKGMTDMRGMEEWLPPEQYAAAVKTAKPGPNGELYIENAAYNALIPLMGQKISAETSRAGQEITKKGQKIGVLQSELSPLNKIPEPTALQKVGGALASGAGALTRKAGKIVQKVTGKGGKLAEKAAGNIEEFFTPTEVAAVPKRELLRGQIRRISDLPSPELRNLEQNAQDSITDAAIGIRPMDNATLRAQEILRANNKPVTPANVAEVKRRMGM